jgi:hypothetical protein
MTSDLERGIAATNEIVDADEADTVFGKRWGSQLFRLTEQDIDALRQGKYLALDILGEYIAYLEAASTEERHD